MAGTFLPILPSQNAELIFRPLLISIVGHLGPTAKLHY